MAKVKRKIIMIDEDKCDGCGQCLPGCPEGALQVIDGKVRLVKESYCDGLGACLGHCPRGALKVVERPAEEYDALAVLEHLEKQSPELAERHRQHLRAHGMEEAAGARPGQGCPSGQVFSRKTGEPAGQAESPGANISLGQWPVKLYLIPPTAEFLKNADLVLVADCVPFAYGNMHSDFLKGKAVAAGCPKFDDTGAHREKIQQVLESVNIRSITVIHMEIPCCSGFVRLVGEALKNSGMDIPFESIQIGINGEILKHEIIKPQVSF